MNAIRIIHNLPRSGGTIINKAISAQKDIVLLSEIHPNGHEIRKAMQSKPCRSPFTISRMVQLFCGG